MSHTFFDRKEDMGPSAAGHRALAGYDGPLSAPLAQRVSSFGETPGSTQNTSAASGCGFRSASDPVSVPQNDTKTVDSETKADNGSIHAFAGAQNSSVTRNTGMNTDQGVQMPTRTAATSKQTGLDRILENPSSSLEHSSLLPRRFGNAVPTTAVIKTSENMHVGQPLRSSLFPETTRPGIQPFGLTGSYSWQDGGESPEQLVYRLQQGFSPNYYGNIFAERNKSANVPDHENCSVFLTGLPIGTTVRCLLENICNFGRVYSTHINPPDVATGHLHSAAKIVFFDAFSTQKFIHHCGTEGMQIRGHVVRAVHNRVKSYAARESRMASRVLLIYGPVEIVNPQSLNDFFSRFFKYEVDCIISHGASRHTPDCVLIEYRFASYRCQAQSAKKWLRSSFPGSVDVFYGEDPCALPPSRIANERFLWDMFWGTKITARAIMMDMAEQQAVAAATARMTSGVRPSNRWTPPNDRQYVFE